MEDGKVTQSDLNQLERLIEAKLSSLRAWGVAALLGGQALAAVIAGVIAPDRAAQVVEAVGRALPLV